MEREDKYQRKLQFIAGETLQAEHGQDSLRTINVPLVAFNSEAKAKAYVRKLNLLAKGRSPTPLYFVGRG